MPSSRLLSLVGTRPKTGNALHSVYLACVCECMVQYMVNLEREREGETEKWARTTKQTIRARVPHDDRRRTLVHTHTHTIESRPGGRFISWDPKKKIDSTSTVRPPTSLFLSSGRRNSSSNVSQSTWLAFSSSCTSTALTETLV